MIISKHNNGVENKKISLMKQGHHYKMMVPGNIKIHILPKIYSEKKKNIGSLEVLNFYIGKTWKHSFRSSIQ